ncbi:MAG: aldose 1-epimerase family protein, partial [Spirochaetota bacterium]
VRAVEVNTGGGLVFTLLPDRGLDIAGCSYKGVNLIYLTPSGIANPAFFEPQGTGWLRTFFGGLLTTCGLTYFGPPGRDGKAELGLHGRYSSLPAEKVSDLSRWEGDEYVLEVSGVVEECVLFGDNIRLKRTIFTALGKKAFTLCDSVENFGFRTSPFTVLYHINTGFPLLDECSELVISSTGAEPYDQESEKGAGEMKRFSAPLPNFREQNFLHTMACSRKGYGLAAMINRTLLGGLGLYIKFKTDTLPFLSEWKMMGEKDYAAALEPCNTKIENRAALRKHKRLPQLRPGETRETRLEIGVLEGKEELEEFSTEADKVR